YLAQARRPIVFKLFQAVVDNLCRLLDCKANYLPQMIEDTWGRTLTPHGYALDAPAVAHGASPKWADYLSRMRRRKYRLVFQGGLAYQFAKDPPFKLVPAESASFGWQDGRGPTAPPMMAPGFAGFALSMGRDFYMAPHKGCFPSGNFYHS